MKRYTLIFIIIGILIININPMTIYAYNNYWSSEAIADFIHNDINLSDNILNDEKFTENITREEFAELIVSMYVIFAKVNIKDIPLKENPFKDTNSINVQRAYSLGLVNGVSESTYSPETNITREALATIITRFLNINGIQTNSEGDLNDYSDNKNISKWAYDSMLYCVKQEIIKGSPQVDSTNYLGPQYFATREQVLIVLDRIALKNEWITPSEDYYYNGFFSRRDDTELDVRPDKESISIPIQWVEIESYEKLEEELLYMLNSKLTDTEQIDKLIETVMNTEDYHLTNQDKFRIEFEIDEYEITIGSRGSIDTKKNRQLAKSWIKIKKIIE